MAAVGSSRPAPTTNERVSSINNTDIFGVKHEEKSDEGGGQAFLRNPERLLDLPMPGSTRTVYNVHIKGSLDDMLRATGQRVEPAAARPPPLPPASDFEAFMKAGGKDNTADRTLFRVLRGIYGKVMNARTTEEEAFKECFNARYINKPMNDINGEWDIRCLLYTDLIRMAIDRFVAWLPDVSMETFLSPPAGTKGDIYLRLIEMAAWEHVGNSYVKINVWAGPANVKALEEKRLSCIMSLATALPESSIGGDVTKDQLLMLLNEQLRELARRK